jgi:CRISPR-associated protein Cas2
MRQLHQKLKTLVKQEEDDVRLYWIPANAVARALTIGSSPPEHPPDVYIV